MSEIHPKEEAVHMSALAHLRRAVHREQGAFDGCDVIELEDGHQVIISGKVDLGVLAYDAIAVALWLYNYHADVLEHMSKDFYAQRDSKS